MEGPSIVIAKEEVASFKNKVVLGCQSRVKTIKPKDLVGREFKAPLSWGKHFILRFAGPIYLRVHFLMFGSYTVNKKKPGRIPKLTLKFENGFIHFYSCAIGRLDQSPTKIYDWTTDPFSPKWDEKKVTALVLAQPASYLCDVLMDQTIFSGVGNIIKNEVLYRLKLHPLDRIGTLTRAEIRALVRETRRYCFDFYEWKREFTLIKHWLIYRRKKCLVHNLPPTILKTGKLDRVSFFCDRCQRPR